jgi:uncharacterized protein
VPPANRTSPAGSCDGGFLPPASRALEVVPQAALRVFLTPRSRSVPLRVPLDPTSTLGHLVQSIGIPLTEVGELTLNGEPAPEGARVDTAGRLDVADVVRPQPCPTYPPRFLLDVHLGSLARRLWVLGIDAEYGNDATDDDLVRRAIAQQRVLLTQDRGLLRRRALPHGAYVRGSSVDEQADDVLDRFGPPLAPWTRCGACGAVLEGVDPADIGHLLQPGTRRTYADFARCTSCGRPFWHGAHARRLDAAVRRAARVVQARASRASSGGPEGEE